MKILAVRGQNLASLDGVFEIDLDKGILGQVGLFAITGPTGAGKSTLLDAICLCLYDKTPRLADRGGNPVRIEGVVDETALKANDQRNILRRGTGQGWAEVDFTGRDGRGYTARWEVRRARKSPTGNVQPQSWSLRRLGEAVDNVLAAGKKAEVEAAIRQQVGLDFDQFRRSVLLAQGEFAAFLQASEHERAVLLEQMTGSEIYTRLSRAAFQKKRALEQGREKLEIQLGEHAVLGTEARQAAEAALQTSAARRQSAGLVEKAAESAVAWHTEDKRLTALFVQAETERTLAARAVAEAGPRKARFEAWHKAWPVRVLAADERTARARATKAQAQAAQTQAAATAANTHLEAARGSLRASQSEAAGAWHALAEQLEGRLDRARTARSRLQDWLEDHKILVELAAPDRQRQLVGHEDRVGIFDKRVELVARRHRLQTVVRTERVAALAKARRQLTEATTARTAADTALAAASARTAAAHAAAQAVQARLPPERAAELATRRQAHTTLGTVAKRAEDALRQRKLGKVQAATKRVEADRSKADGAAAKAAVAATQGVLQTAEHTLQRARAAVDADGLRQRLVPGEPCAVCGSEAHPWAEGSPLMAVFDELERTVAEHRTALDAARSKQVEAESRHQAALEATRLAVAQIADADERLAVLSAEWTAACDALPGPLADKVRQLADQVGLDDTAAHLDDLVRTLEADETRLRFDQAEERRLRGIHDQLQATERKALAARDAAVARSESAARDVPALEQAVVAVDRDVEEIDKRVDGMDNDLALTLDPLAAELDKDSAILRWRDHLNAPTPVLAALRRVAAEVSHKHKRLSEAVGVTEELMAAAPVARTHARQTRAALPPDAAPAAVAAPLQSPPEQTTWLEQHAQAADRTVVQAAASLHAAEARAQQAREQATAAQAAHHTQAAAADSARQRLSAETVRHGLDDGALTALCALPEGWTDTERAALGALDQRLQAAMVREQERKEVCRVHLAKRPEADAPTAEARLAAAQAERAAADEQWSTCRARIDRDDRSRGAAQRLQAALEAHDQAAEPWLQLARCIGSATGKEFRKYAQSLTLELLLGQANAHLRRLHPRYRLARIAGTDLDILVVDSDLGDEVRTIRSLSGGEGFLVSLALALGLSSLSAGDVRVESLFIDEGFGTLDSSSLDKALSVLDSLQSEGRQVGIISHVGGLAERIGVRVAVEPQGGGRSVVKVLGG